MSANTNNPGLEKGVRVSPAPEHVPGHIPGRDGFSISVLNRAKAFTLRRMTGSLEHRIRKALGRFSPSIKKVKLVLEDENGPRGGFDKRASVQVTLAGGGYLSATGQGTLFARALSYSLEQINGHMRKIRGRRISSRKRKAQFHENHLFLQPKEDPSRE
jgi:hypothetical protein